MILKQRSTLFKKCMYLHKHQQSVKGKHALHSQHLGQLHGFKHRMSFPLKKARTSKATKSSLKNSSTASASLTPTRLPKPVELQSLVLEWQHSIGLLLQRHCISEFQLKHNVLGIKSEIYAATLPMFWGFFGFGFFFWWVVSRGYFLKPCRD